MNVLLVCPQTDEQSGLYLLDSLVDLGHNVAFYDQREQIKQQGGVEQMRRHLVASIAEGKPEFTLFIKAGEFDATTIKAIRQIHNHPMACWIFDVTIGGMPVEKAVPYIEMLKELDAFFTIDADAVPVLKNLGVNAHWLSEGCYLPQHQQVVFNSIQKKRYGSDIVFMGSVGGIHPNRNAIMKRIHDEGFSFKLYGEVLFPENTEPDWVKDSHTGFAAINDYHSLVAEASKIVIGIDGWPMREGSWSARLYRTLCAKGFLLTTHTKGIEKYFTPGVHLETFKSDDEMVEKIIKYLQDDEAREKIAEAGQKLVQEKHQFIHRLPELIQKTLETFK